MWGAPPATTASTVPVSTIVLGKTLDLEISRDRKDSSTVYPRNDHTLPPESIIAQNTDSYDDDKYIASAGDVSHRSALEDGGITLWDDEL